MQGKIDGEENARRGKKIQGGQKKLKGKKKEKKEEKGKKSKKNHSNSNEISFFLKNDNSAVKNKGKGQNNLTRISKL